MNRDQRAVITRALVVHPVIGLFLSEIVCHSAIGAALYRVHSGRADILRVRHAEEGMFGIQFMDWVGNKLNPRDEEVIVTSVELVRVVEGMLT